MWLYRRLIEFYTSGSIEGANKRSVDDLYAVFQDYLGTKRQKSSHITGISLLSPLLFYLFFYSYFIYSSHALLTNRH